MKAICWTALSLYIACLAAWYIVAGALGIHSLADGDYIGAFALPVTMGLAALPLRISSNEIRSLASGRWPV